MKKAETAGSTFPDNSNPSVELLAQFKVLVLIELRLLPQDSKDSAFITTLDMLLRINADVLLHAITLVIFGREVRLPKKVKLSNVWKTMEVFRMCSPFRKENQCQGIRIEVPAGFTCIYSERVRQSS